MTEQAWIYMSTPVWLHGLTRRRVHCDRTYQNTDDTATLMRRGVVGYALATGTRTNCGGFAIVEDTKELVGLWSEVPGQGDFLVSDAVRRGATNLNCFDGYLVELYERHGFKEYRREKNYNPVGPDVVYMRLETEYD